MKDLKPYSYGDPSHMPDYAYEAVDLTLLPPDYLSSRLCILDFDEAFLTESPPPHLSRNLRQYLAPEAIFRLINGPAADIWALGLMLFSLRTSTQLFWDPASCNPESTVSRMCQVLGSLPPEWLDFPFQNGYPVHRRLWPYATYSSFRDLQTDRDQMPARWKSGSTISRNLANPAPAAHTTFILISPITGLPAVARARTRPTTRSWPEPRGPSRTRTLRCSPICCGASLLTATGSALPSGKSCSTRS